jgi:hypothetical protein
MVVGVGTSLGHFLIEDGDAHTEHLSRLVTSLVKRDGVKRGEFLEKLFLIHHVLRGDLWCASNDSRCELCRSLPRVGSWCSGHRSRQKRLPHQARECDAGLTEGLTGHAEACCPRSRYRQGLVMRMRWCLKSGVRDRPIPQCDRLLPGLSLCDNVKDDQVPLSTHAGTYWGIQHIFT